MSTNPTSTRLERRTMKSEAKKSVPGLTDTDNTEEKIVSTANHLINKAKKGDIESFETIKKIICDESL